MSRLFVVITVLLTAFLARGAEAAVVTAAGDIASCGSSEDSATGDLIRAIDPTVALTLGDNVYGDGTASQFTECYKPSWGSFRWKTRPSPGNHDYHTADAIGYFSFFARRAGPCCRGYFKFDVGSWRLYSLNSEGDIPAQAAWLDHDLRANPHTCTLAYWHRPRFSDSKHGDSMLVDPLWRTFAANGGDVVLAGHDHNYQRFPLIDGVRSFVVGTGGASLYDVVPERVAAYDDTHWGVLRLALRPGYYTWKFRRVGAASIDRGTETCTS